MIDPALTVDAAKHLSYLKHLNSSSQLSEQALKDFAYHAGQLHAVAWQMLQLSQAAFKGLQESRDGASPSPFQAPPANSLTAP